MAQAARRERTGPVSFSGISDVGLVKSFSYIGGRWQAAGSGASFAVTDPSTGGELGHVAQLSAAESATAVDEAAAAFPAWSGLLPQERSRLLRRWFDLMVAAREDLARIMTQEQGKPLSEARGEIDYAAAFIEFYAEEAKRPNIESVTSHLPDAEMEVWREPVGVAALVTPWNFPSAMITRKAAAALAAGCTVVVHPSGETPYSALALAELAERAGIPAGVFNVVTGKAPEIVEPWTMDTRVRALSFTGSTEIGRLLYRQSADTMKRLVMELGGHAPFIVFADADLDQAVEEAVKAKFATSGQDCLGANRFFIERPVYDAFCEKLAAATKALTVGAGLEDRDIGPLMNEKAVQKQESHVADALEKGARLLVGGKRHDAGPLFFQPTVLANVPDDALIMHEETFGPVAAIAPFDTEDEALTRANATDYGLVAYLHTQDPRRIYRASRTLQFGMVAVNRTKVTGAPIPFGGFKQSGIGREGARLGMEAFMEVKYVCRDWA
ncbi:Succinate-semialdehyde dehydrogenase [NADP(+)] GabD [Hartmannibacter diazotrophicus]|uniref:Succinate-semialdehyde dehydrogenase [NADP(+)] GabD n=1 Tax=Hartmannibacter diazotrophicus TaxID=1482074 RepID=A0A2C9D5M7_9HYPH|nr:NAD-dependent succinate-semialdehyde dehydrogenase [Hartmannibacter diazotrophicus]SON55624.1 Succinate-semialdehyde dehydrogenase [NADP(+)] GabD [Hartmannibacter diazotrophicus]